MALPRVLKNLNLFNDGTSYMGQVGEVTIPKLVRKFEAWRGGGMNGAVKVDLGLADDTNEFDWKLGGLDEQILRQWGVTKVAGVLLRFAGAYQRDDTGDTSAVEIVIRGRHESIEMGTAKPGEKTEVSIKTIWSYLKITVDGEVILEIDIPGMVEKVNGVDLLAAQRKALGL